MVNTVFQEPVHQVLEKIKNGSYFKLPNKMGGDPMRHNQSLHYQYHQERVHTTEDCRTLWNHLEQLVREGGDNNFVSDKWARRPSKVRSSGECFFKAPLGTINVIFAALERTGSQPSRVMFVARPSVEDSNP